MPKWKKFFILALIQLTMPGVQKNSRNYFGDKYLRACAIISATDFPKQVLIEVFNLLKRKQVTA